MVGLPIFAAIKPAWLNKFSFWLSVLQLLSLYLGLSGLKTAPKSLVLLATAKAFPIGPGRIELSPGYSFYVDYPLIPWLGVMTAGYSFGPVFLQSENPRKALLFRLGIGFGALFLLLRLSNLYGDPEA